MVAIATAIATVIATIAAVALATHAPIGDPDDTRGPLDVRRVRLLHDDGPPEWTVVTFSRWTTRSIWDRGHVFVFLDTIGDSDADYFAHIRSNGRRLLGALWRIPAKHGARDRWLRSLVAWRDSGRRASVRVPLGSMNIGPSRTFFRWWVYTSFVGDRCRSTCIDRAPNTGSRQQWLPGFSPSPSPTDTPSPTGPTGPTGP
jgi:hypothetical protein